MIKSGSPFLSGPGSFLVLLALTLAGCQTTGSDRAPAPLSAIESMYIQGTVVKSFKGKAIVEVAGNNYDEASDFESLLGDRILEATYLTEGTATEINGVKASVLERRGKLVVLQTNESVSPGEGVELYIPKKTLVVSDFTVESKNKEKAGELVFNNFAARLTNSGRYLVVERDQLAEVLQEHSLELTGLTDPRQASFVGKILKAELLLTGNMEMVGDKCIFNIRVIDVPTSKIITQVREETSCSTLQKIDLRSTLANLGSFENGNEKGWLLGTGKNSYTGVDKNTGAAGTRQSLKMAFQISGRRNSAFMKNVSKRDLSGFTGLVFYAKASKEMIAAVMLVDANGYLDKKNDGWVKTIQLGPEWEKFTVNFADLVLAKAHQRKEPGGDGILSLEFIERIELIIPFAKNEGVANGTVWLDEVSLF